MYAGTSNCADQDTKCPQWKNQYCEDPSYVDWMAENCAKTCGKCDGTVVKGMYSDDLIVAASFQVKFGRRGMLKEINPEMTRLVSHLYVALLKSQLQKLERLMTLTVDAMKVSVNN